MKLFGIVFLGLLINCFKQREIGLSGFFDDQDEEEYQ
jgi:hypothetical protein